jgi:hypothetical protein
MDVEGDGLDPWQARLNVSPMYAQTSSNLLIARTGKTSGQDRSLHLPISLHLIPFKTEEGGGLAYDLMTK